MRQFQIHHPAAATAAAAYTPSLPDLAGWKPKTYAPSPVWRDSTTKKVRFQPLPKRQAVRLYHDARRFERQTRRPGRQDGALGRNGLAVLHALLFDFLNHASGRLDPSYKAIARKACLSLRSAARGLAKLKAVGVLYWQRRAGETRDALGRFCLDQDTNAYGVISSSCWHGFIKEPPAPPPHPTTWGACPPLLDQLSQAMADRRAGDNIDAVLARLADDPGDIAACAIASLFREVFGVKP
jgi:hypothetical protein